MDKKMTRSKMIQLKTKTGLIVAATLFAGVVLSGNAIRAEEKASGVGNAGAPLRITRAGESPAHGVRSVTPGSRWEDAFVTGNGRMGALLYGTPASATCVITHCRNYMQVPGVVPDIASHLPEWRQLFREKKYVEAVKDYCAKAKAGGLVGRPEYFGEGLFIEIRQIPEGEVSGYERTEDFATGEVVERWRDGRGQFRRRMFVSRTDNLVALEITGPVPCEIKFPWKRQPDPDGFSSHSAYRLNFRGYDTVARVVRKDEGRHTLLLVRIVPWKAQYEKGTYDNWANSPENPDFAQPGQYRPAPPTADSSVVAYRTAADAKALLAQVKESLAAVNADYDALFAPHAQAHGALFNRCTLDLGGGTERGKNVDELLELAVREKQLPPALMEKMYDAGRYMFICCAGEMAPNLQGIWNGWRGNPPWGDSFTLDTNLEAAMSSACSANLADLMEGYFRLIEGFYPEWRINAKRIYGCRGFFTGIGASNTALATFIDIGWPLQFWTAGCGWLARFFSDYAEYSGDREFLAKRCVPLLKEIAAFYEDFLVETDATGHAVFNPSYNPETGTGINATMDVAVARDVLTKLIDSCKELKIEGDNLPRWEKLLARLPAYPVNAEGVIPEFPDQKFDPTHRHHSQLYGCFQSFDSLFETDAALRAAAQATVRAKIAGSAIGQPESFGRGQAGISAAYLGLAEEAYSRLQLLAVKRSMHPSLITANTPNARLFIVDGNGLIPQIANTMLLFSRPGRIDLLPALPKAWAKGGTLKGVCARGGFELDITWADGRLTQTTIRSRVGGATLVRYGDKAVQLNMKPGESVTLDDALNRLP